jgi:catechol 2,3-dioxygenase-like lactoylglutathione lyase family enzyme
MRTICLVLLFAAGGWTSAQTSQTAETPRAVAVNGAFFALSVPDLQASTQWYSEKLGLKIVMDAIRNEKSTVTVLEGDGLIVELIQNDDAVPLSKAVPAAKSSVDVRGIFNAGVIVNDFEQTLAMLRARHAEIVIGPFPARNGQRANVIVKDNACNLIQFFGK